MPRVRRQNIPPQLLAHLLERVQPEVPEGKWFKEFSEMTVCGEGELVKTFLHSGQIPIGEKL